ncbi:hypothetical protein F5I97DRAFT_677267 [Phlebopus sp. FC_14]|nr:hypothetical protein F5I97DRAFT_677267 [Phlebopus sp. FC_14]
MLASPSKGMAVGANPRRIPRILKLSIRCVLAHLLCFNSMAFLFHTLFFGPTAFAYAVPKSNNCIESFGLICLKSYPSGHRNQVRQKFPRKSSAVAPWPPSFSPRKSAISTCTPYHCSDATDGFRNLTTGQTRLLRDTWNKGELDGIFTSSICRYASGYGRLILALLHLDLFGSCMTTHSGSGTVPLPKHPAFRVVTPPSCSRDTTRTRSMFL